MNTRMWRNFFHDLKKEEPKYDPNLSLIEEELFLSDLTSDPVKAKPELIFNEIS